MDEALDRFTEAFNGPVFDDIIKSAQTDKLNRIYFDDFLGDADFTITGSPIVSIMTVSEGCDIKYPFEYDFFRIYFRYRPTWGVNNIK